MVFTDNNIFELLSRSKSFLLEGFNIFFIGEDNLPHIVCTAPNKSTARAIHGLLEIAKKAGGLPGICSYMTGNAALVPQVLATGQTVLPVMTILSDETFFKDGVEVKIDAQYLDAGTPQYDQFIEKLRKA
jgi:5'-3' exonuclease